MVGAVSGYQRATRIGVALIGAEIAMAAFFGLAGLTGHISGTAYAAVSPQEDDPQWACYRDGNRVCGPDNANGAVAGCYDDGGALVALWPCARHEGTGALPG